MGQVTHIMVIKENLKGEKKVKLLQHNWGYGRTMYLAFMDLFLQEYFADKNADYDFFKVGIKPVTGNDRFIDMQECEAYDFYERLFSTLPTADINDIKTIKAIFDRLGNNNGGLVVYMLENNEIGEYSKIKIGFLLGDCDCEYEEPTGLLRLERCVINKGNDREPFERWLTPAEYGRMNGGRDYSDKEFVKMFEAFCKYFGIEYIR